MTTRFLSREFRADAEAASFIGEQLQYLYPRLIETVFASPEWAKHLPLEDGGDPGVREMGFDIYTPAGAAEIFQGDGWNLPEVGISRERVMTKVYQFGINRSISDWDLDSAALEVRRLRALGQQNPIGLDQGQQRAAADAVAQFHDRAALLGDAENGLPGLIGQPNLPSYAAPVGAGGSALWDDKTAEEIVDDLTALVSLQMNTAKVEAFYPDRLLLPLNKYLLAASKKMEGTNESALTYFERTNPRGNLLKVTSWVRLNGLGSGGTGIAFCYKFDVDVLSYRAPMLYMIHDPARGPAGFKWTHSGRSAGTGVKRPFAVAQMQGF